MASLIQMAVRGSQFFWTMLVTALVADVIAHGVGGNPSAINYAIFVAVWCWIAVIYGLVAAFTSMSHAIGLLVLDGMAVLWTFIAGVVLAAKLGVHSCGNNDYLAANELTAGGQDPSKRCHELQASTAFFWFLFASFAVSLALDFSEGKSALGGRGGMRRGGPSMSQV